MSVKVGQANEFASLLLRLTWLWRLLAWPLTPGRNALVDEASSLARLASLLDSLLLLPVSPLVELPSLPASARSSRPFPLLLRLLKEMFKLLCELRSPASVRPKTEDALRR